MQSSSMTIQMKATEQCFPVVLFITLYRAVLTFESVDETIQIKLLSSTFLEGVFLFISNQHYVEV